MKLLDDTDKKIDFDTLKQKLKKDYDENRVNNFKNEIVLKKGTEKYSKCYFYVFMCYVLLSTTIFVKRLYQYPMVGIMNNSRKSLENVN